MKKITKIVLKNFKKFKELEVLFNKEMNIFVGDNEAGKSTVLTALDFVISGSRHKVEKAGLEHLFNVDVISSYLASDRNLEDLPQLIVDVYLNEQHNMDLNGQNNLTGENCDGLRLHCYPMEDYHSDIQSALASAESNFPFEYYAIKFLTFSGEAYNGYKKYLKHLFIDSSLVSNEYATREYVRDVYHLTTTNTEKYKLKNEYRQSKRNFETNSLSSLNENLEEYKFGIRHGEKHSVEEDLVILENEIPIDNMGKGRQSFVKTEFALKRNNENDLDMILLEEPENHLSHTNMRKLIDRIAKTSNKQVFVATHSSLIASRLGLNLVHMMRDNGNPIRLKDLPGDTPDFFIKAPDNNILEFLLSDKVLLVEGSAEYILMEALFKNVTETNLNSSGVHIVSVNGLSFKRYLDIATILNKKVAVVRDNDGHFEENCINNYSSYTSENIKVFSDSDDTKHTFEVCFYGENKNICDELFQEGRRTLSVLDYMLGNKTDAALELLLKKESELIAPDYIKEAIEWIKS